MYYPQRDKDGKVVGAFTNPNPMTDDKPMTKEDYIAFSESLKPKVRKSPFDKLVDRLVEKSILTEDDARSIK